MVLSIIVPLRLKERERERVSDVVDLVRQYCNLTRGDHNVD